MTIRDEQISVLVQGPVDQNIYRCVKSIRKYLPGSDIVLSTWRDCPLNNIDYDILCIQDDPGANKIRTLRNIYRQIIGRKQGLKECNKLYTLIIRSDSEILNLNFIRAFQKELKNGGYSQYKWLKSRVVMCSAGYTANALFFLNDWFFFGRTEDIRDIYDIPVIDEDSLPEDERKLPDYNSPHEYLAMKFCKKKMNLDYNYEYFHDPHYREIWEKILVENFVMIGFYKDYGISNLKEPYYSNQLLNRYRFLNGVVHLMKNYEHEDWYMAYNRLYHEHVKTQLRVRWIIARILIKIYRFIKPIHV